MNSIDWSTAPAFGRRTSILHTLHLLAERRPGPAIIVETGTVRDSNSTAMSGDGWSAIAWAWYCSQVGGRVYTVDINPNAVETCRQVTRDWAAWIEYVVADSVTFLTSWSQPEAGPIDLLYLDSLDYHDRESSERHSLAEAAAALPNMTAAGIVLLDDTHGSGTNADGQQEYWGKGRLSIPFLLANGYELLSDDGGQVLLGVNIGA